MGSLTIKFSEKTHDGLRMAKIKYNKDIQDIIVEAVENDLKKKKL
jgi:hypothetical protein